MSTAEVVAKAIGIVAAIDRCGCQHCLELLKRGLGNQPNPADDDTATIPGISRNDRQEIIR
jgi:hypothetical protein